MAAGQECFLKGNSILTLALMIMTISKLLSPSHATQSYSLYAQYRAWREENGLPNEGFLGFKENRFGRRAKLACMFLDHREHFVSFLTKWWMNNLTA